MKHVALLRGINVGGNNIIKMVELRASFETMGFTDVTTYIASGNVVFSAKPATKATLTKRIESALSRDFGYESRIVLVSAKELALVVAQAPRGFGKQPDRYRYDVMFVKEPLTTAEALERVPRRAGVDEVHAGTHAIYYRRLVSQLTKSHVSKVVALPIYQSMTLRNWNTTTKLLALVS